jgi:hypothetical protein
MIHSTQGVKGVIGLDRVGYTQYLPIEGPWGWIYTHIFGLERRSKFIIHGS